MKSGPATTAKDVLALTEALDPDREPGRLTLITRMSAGRITDVLPPLVEEVTANGTPVAWVCDPMHANTSMTASGHKTRDFDDVLAEVTGFFEVHRALGTHPGGIHLEFTGDDVTECTGGGHHLTEGDLHHRYRPPRPAPQPEPVPRPGLPGRGRSRQHTAVHPAPPANPA